MCSRLNRGAQKMPLNSHQLLEEADRQLADLQAVSLEAIRAIQDFVAVSRVMETASRKLINESRQLLANTAKLATGYKATVYAAPLEEPNEPRLAA
jgi:hypothetical protein